MEQMEQEEFTVAPLRNVALCTLAMEKAMARKNHLANMIVFHGPSGFGKTYAAMYTMMKRRAVYVMCMSTWTRKDILNAISRGLGIVPKGSLADMTQEIALRLDAARRPLIIDEMDHIVQKGAVEVIRDIADRTKMGILLIGEEALPEKLSRWERFHGRLLPSIAAQPADMEDARILAQLYCDVAVNDDLLQSIVTAARGSIRRICVNLSLIEETALSAGKKVVDLEIWRSWKKGLWTGDTEQRVFK